MDTTFKSITSRHNIHYVKFGGINLPLRHSPQGW